MLIVSLSAALTVGGGLLGSIAIDWARMRRRERDALRVFDDRGKVVGRVIRK
jgi:hypothetical protein